MMILSKTPFRVSFFGGGTDYPVWYRENPGAVLATSIDKYCFINCRYLPPFFEHKHRIVYSKMEEVQNIGEVHHPAVRETVRFMQISDGLEIHHDADLPARAGMGTSSSFTVGLLHALYALKEIMVSKMRLAKEAIHIEQEMIKENVGSQDQVTAAVGGFNRIDFSDDDIKVTPIILTKERLEQLQSSLMLFFTGFSRTASQIAESQIRAAPSRSAELKEMYEMVGRGVDILSSKTTLSEFGQLLDQAWKLKRSLTKQISNPYIDYLYETAKKAGAEGGKVLGAGGRGFVLLFVVPELQDRVREALHGLLEVPFRFENEGSSIIFMRT